MDFINSENYIFIGIDCGRKGAWSIIQTNKDFFVTSSHSFLWDDALFINSMKSLLLNRTNSENIFCYLEKVHSMPGQGVASTFKFGSSFGYIKGVLDTLNINYDEVTPQYWKKKFDLIKKEKSESAVKALEIFPEVNLLPTPRCKKPSDGMAEALLIAECCRLDKSVSMLK